MISQILDYTKKYYPWSLDTNGYAIETDGITGLFSATYQVGQYVNIQNSVLNDGTYKITALYQHSFARYFSCAIFPLSTHAPGWPPG